MMVMVVVMIGEIERVRGTKVCNVLDYGVVADNKTDIRPGLYRAYMYVIIINQ